MFEHDDDDPALRRLVAEERAVLDATELISELLDRSGVSRSELAQRLGVGPSEISHRLRGRNLTVKSLAATLDALDHTLHITAAPRDGHRVKLTPVSWVERRLPTPVTTRPNVTYGAAPAQATHDAGVYRIAV